MSPCSAFRDQIGAPNRAFISKLVHLHKTACLKFSYFYKKINEKIRKNYCIFCECVVKYMSLICEDARGCRRDAGNFRGVCPKIGRKSMQHPVFIGDP